MRIDPQTIRPKVNGHSDFFSWQLFRWVRKHAAANSPHPRTQVFRTDRTALGGQATHGNGRLWIGWKSSRADFLGRDLRELCHYGRRLHSWSIGPGPGWVDCTEQFWADYMRRGVCAIHGDNAHRWHEPDPDHRVCLNCGHVERRRVRMIEQPYWESDELTRAALARMAADGIVIGNPHGTTQVAA